MVSKSAMRVPGTTVMHHNQNQNYAMDWITIVMARLMRDAVAYSEQQDFAIAIF
jgi:hypothetical protein